MELDVAQVFNLCAELIGEADAIAGGNCGIGGVSVNAANAACRQNAVAAKNAARFVATKQIQAKAATYLRHFTDRAIFDQLDIRPCPDLCQKLDDDLIAGLILVMHDSAAGMAAL